MTFRSTFVRVEGSDDGIGKLVDVRNSDCEIEFFVSPAGPQFHRQTFPTNRVEPIELAAETRVFCQDRLTWQWWAGRIKAPISAEAIRKAEDHYEVQFPNDVIAPVPISNLHVRWAHPIEDPTDYLAARITDTPYFFDGRTQIVRHLASQRAGFGGLSGLASAAVELLEHQVTTVRRVLADPIERYLLADEVGLGKTIEAGILIRQHVIDQSHRARVLVVVPAHLVAQWEGELQTKFSLSPSSVIHVVSEEDIVAAQIRASKLSLLVVDEAHRGALHAFDPDPRRRTYYERLCQLALSAPRVLLLSGTPVLHQEDGFLAMLHLLDPDAYPLDSREAFRNRVRERQSIAEATSDLTDEASALFVEEALEKIVHLKQQDARLAELFGQVSALVNAETSDRARIGALRGLRLHLTETYRLHRRLLRTRRDDKRLRFLLPQRSGVEVLSYDDHARAEAFDFVETWRLQAGEPLAGSQHPKLFALWVEAALSDPSVLLRAMDERLAAGGSDRETLLGSPWAFEAEEALIRARRTLIVDAQRNDSRVGRLMEWLATLPASSKIIVFISDTEVAERAAETLGEVYGAENVILHDQTAESVRHFEQRSTARALICDQAAEEGLNLQRLSASVVHYDLPLDVARVEQRIGRVDRLEARGRLRNVVLAADCSYEREWLRCIVDAVAVFNRSIAPLQYLLVEETTRIRSQLTGEGSHAFTAASARMLDSKYGLNAELRRIKSQEALDASEGDPERDAAFFEHLQRADESLEDTGEEAVDAWMVERLHFVRREAGREAFRYVHDTKRPTLLPMRETLTRFAECVDRDAERLRRSGELPLQAVTVHRAIAERTGARLLRVGHPLLSSLEELLRADDRGTASALWRFLPEWEGAPQLFFRFDLVVETDLRPVLEATRSEQIAVEAIRRRADDAFPVQFKTVWLDAELKEVVDEEVRSSLEIPYQPRGSEGRRDFNVRLNRWDTVDRLLSIGDWDGLCRRARGAAERALRESSAFQHHALSSLNRLRNEAAHVAQSLQSRISRLSGATRLAEERTADLESALFQGLADGIANPLIRADSAGAVFLADRGFAE